MALMQITIIPLGTASPSVGSYIADTEKLLKDKGIEHTLGDMGTVLHGDPETLLKLAQDIHNLPFRSGAKRVVTNITIDDRRDIERGIGEKRDSVLNRLKQEKKL